MNSLAAPVLDRLGTVNELLALAHEHGLAWPEAVYLYTSGPAAGIAVLTCAAETTAYGWCNVFGDPGVSRKVGVANRDAITWRGWSVSVAWYVPETS